MKLRQTHPGTSGPERTSTIPAGWVPRAVAFDAFGTLVQIGEKRRPYRRLARLAAATTATDPLTADMPVEEWAAAIGAPDALVAATMDDLLAETGSVVLRDWVGEAWAGLRGNGIDIAVCSNLATPYGAPLLAALPDEPDVIVLSYEVGLKKPDPAIYALVAARLGHDPADILFVGDTPSADFDGPVSAGMRALPVSEFEKTWGTLLPGTRAAPV